MKFPKRMLSLVLALVLLSSVFAVTVSAAGTIMQGIGFVKATSLRLRSEPNTSSQVLATAYNNECVVVVSQSGEWYKVIYNLQEGYMHQDYLTVLSRENAELGYGKVTGSGVNLRSGPSTGYRVVDVAGQGDKCYIIGLNDGWYKVIFNGHISYIRSDFVELTEFPYENRQSPNTPKFFRGGKSTGVTPSASALNGTPAPSKPAPGVDNSTPIPVVRPEEPTAPVVTPEENPIPVVPEEPPVVEPPVVEPPVVEPPVVEPPVVSVSGQAILSEAQKHLGAPYVWGGASPAGFDCSGFVYYVLKTVGLSPNRTPEDQFRQGTPVDRSDLQPGDVVFFYGTYADKISHVGIYAGNGQFIHSPNSRSVVSYSDLTSGYWGQHYYGARRMA